MSFHARARKGLRLHHEGKTWMCLINMQPLQFIPWKTMFTSGPLQGWVLEAVLHQRFTFYLNLYFKAVFGIEINFTGLKGCLCVGIWPCWAVGAWADNSNSYLLMESGHMDRAVGQMKKHFWINMNAIFLHDVDFKNLIKKATHRVGVRAEK